MNLFLQRVSRFLIFVCPVTAFAWWREKGEFTGADALGFAGLTLLLVPLGIWLGRRTGAWRFDRD